MAISTDLGQRLRQARDYKRLTQGQAAELVGVSLRSIVGHEKGIHRPPDATIRRYCDVYECSRDWLLTGRGEPFLKKSGDGLPGKGPPSSPLSTRRIDASILRDVIKVVEQYLQEEELYLAPDKKADLIILLYEEIQESERKPSKDKVIQLIRLAA